MTTILIPREPIPVALTAEQVVAYLLRPGSGWVEVPTLNTSRAFRWEANDPVIVVIGRNPSTLPIEGIACAESRPAEQVAADIAGPVVGIGGVGCEALTVREARPMWQCFWTLQRNREDIEGARQRARRAASIPLCADCGDPLNATTTADECSAKHDDVAPRAPEVE